MAGFENATLKTGKEVSEREYAGVKISLENCLFPLEACQETPSQKDGLEKAVENDLRRLGCKFIQIAGIMLRVPQVAMASAQVLFQRFFFAKSFVRHKMEEIAMACIWLASKVEECPRRVRDVINIFYYFRLKRDKLPTAPMVLDQEYITLKNNVIKAERRVLKELGFCVHVKHPHKIIVVYLQVLELEKNRELVQTAWNYMNDSLQTTVFVQYPPETIACACIYLAARVLQIPLPNRPNWFYLFNTAEDDIQKICVTLLSVYQTVETSYEILLKKVDACRDAIQQEKIKARSIVAANNDNSATNSPNSKPESPATSSPVKDGRSQNVHRSSTMPTRHDSGRTATNGSRKNEIRRSHDSGLKRSRTRSASNNRSIKFRKQSSESASPLMAERVDDRKSGHLDKLPKSYSQPNNGRDSEERRRRRKKREGKSRHSKRHRRDEQKTRDLSRSGRYESSSKKQKRKHSSAAADNSPLSKPSPRLNGEKAPSTSPTSRSLHRGSRRKKPRRSESPRRRSKR